MSLEYESESKTSTGSALSLYNSPLPLSPPIDSPPPYHNISQINLHEIIQQQQEQLAAMQAQIQALLAVTGAAAGIVAGPYMKVAKLAIFNRKTEKVREFIMACRLFLKMKLRGAMVEKQVQWVLSYVQEESTNVWKKNVMEELESVEVEYYK